jgi:HNH endonuclease
MDQATQDTVRHRARGRCEYCGMWQAHIVAPFHIEHIIAKQHGGTDEISNLALACDRCNAFKGPNLSAIDSATGAIVTLFHPRKDDWHVHFTLRDGLVLGKTDIGRATARLLNMNAHHRVQLRLETGDIAGPI